MTMDEKFILGDVDKRVEQAATLVASACEYGSMSKSLCRPGLSAGEYGARINARRRRSGAANWLAYEPASVLKTTVGLNNISHDTKNPRLIERTFLAMLIGAGLSSAIINTRIESCSTR